MSEKKHWKILLSAASLSFLKICKDIISTIDMKLNADYEFDRNITANDLPTNQCQ